VAAWGRFKKISDQKKEKGNHGKRPQSWVTVQMKTKGNRKTLYPSRPVSGKSKRGARVPKSRGGKKGKTTGRNHLTGKTETFSGSANLSKI